MKSKSCNKRVRFYNNNYIINESKILPIKKISQQSEKMKQPSEKMSQGKPKSNFQPLMQIKIPNRMRKNFYTKPRKEIDQTKNYRPPQAGNRKERRARANEEKEKKRADLAREQLRNAAKKAKRMETINEERERRKKEGLIMQVKNPTNSTKVIQLRLKEKREKDSVNETISINREKYKLEKIFEEMTEIKPLIRHIREERKKSRTVNKEDEETLVIAEDYDEL